MKIGFDAKRAFLNSGGLGNYSRTLMKSLAQCFPKNKYFLFSPKTKEDSFTQFARLQNNFQIEIPGKGFEKTFSSYWRSYSITKKIEKTGLDIYHGLSNELPLNIAKSKVKKVVTIHDLIFLRYPEFYSAINRKIYQKKFLAACLNADAIVAVSEQTKKDVVDFFKISKEKINVIYQSCDEIFNKNYSADEINSVRNKYQLPEKFLLYVGTIEERKNLLTIVKALKQVENISLVAIGKKKKYFREIEKFISKNNLSSRIYFPENVSNEELPLLYRAAEIFIYPSVFEGFGIPIIEALWSKVPVITSKGSCFAEAGGSQSFYINPKDEEELASKIKMILQDEILKKKMIDEGYKYVQRFHPEKTSAEIINLYQSLLK